MWTFLDTDILEINIFVSFSGALTSDLLCNTVSVLVELVTKHNELVHRHSVRSECLDPPAPYSNFVKAHVVHLYIIKFQWYTGSRTRQNYCPGKTI